MEEFVNINPQQKFTESQLTIQPEVLKVQQLNKRDSGAMSCHAKMNPDLIKPKNQTTNNIQDRFSSSDYTYQQNAKNNSKLKQTPVIAQNQTSIKKLTISKKDKDKQNSDYKQNLQNPLQKKLKQQQKHRSLRPSQSKNIQSIILQKPTSVLQVKEKVLKNQGQASPIKIQNQKSKGQENKIQLKIEETQKQKKQQKQKQKPIFQEAKKVQIKKKESFKFQKMKDQKIIEKFIQDKKVSHNTDLKQKKLQNIQHFKSPTQSHRQMQKIQKNEMKQTPKYQEIKLQSQQKQESSYSMMKTDNFQNQKLNELKKELGQPIEILKEFQFLMNPVKSSEFVSLSFQRHKSCMLSQPISFYINESSSLESIKSSRVFGSKFIISAKRFGINSQCAILKSNFFGTVYNLSINGNEKDIICSILFNDMKINSNIRSVQIYVKQNINQNFGTIKSYSNLKELYQQEQTPFVIKKFQSKAPFYNQKTKSYVLSFNMEKQNILQSVKNAMLIDQNGQEAFKFCKNSFLTYKVMFKKPFSWLVAYSYALASTDFKILTQ